MYIPCGKTFSNIFFNIGFNFKCYRINHFILNTTHKYIFRLHTTFFFIANFRNTFISMWLFIHIIDLLFIIDIQHYEF